MKKKILSFGVSFLAVLSLASCNKESGTKESGNTTSESTEVYQKPKSLYEQALELHKNDPNAIVLEGKNGGSAVFSGNFVNPNTKMEDIVRVTCHAYEDGRKYNYSLPVPAEKGKRISDAILNYSLYTGAYTPYVCVELEGLYTDETFTTPYDLSLLLSVDENTPDVYLNFVRYTDDSYKVMNGTFVNENQTATFEDGKFTLTRENEVITADVIRRDKSNGTTHFALTNLYCNGVKLDDVCSAHKDSETEVICYEITNTYDEKFNVVFEITDLGNDSITSENTTWSGTKTTAFYKK